MAKIYSVIVVLLLALVLSNCNTHNWEAYNKNPYLEDKRELASITINDKKIQDDIARKIWATIKDKNTQYHRHSDQISHFEPHVALFSFMDGTQDEFFCDDRRQFFAQYKYEVGWILYFHSTEFGILKEVVK